MAIHGKTWYLQNLPNKLSSLVFNNISADRIRLTQPF